MRRYLYINAIRDGEIVEIDGRLWRLDPTELQVGDTYVGERNTGPHLATVRKIDKNIGCIFPEEARIYPYDLHECVKVQEAFTYLDK